MDVDAKSGETAEPATQARLVKQSSSFFLSPQKKLKSMIEDDLVLDRISREDIRLIYTFTKKLGAGSFGSVRAAFKTANQDKKFAVKSILRDSIVGEEDELTQELSILFSADHPNIVRLYEVYLDHKYVHLVTELLVGGDISPERQPSGRFTESEAADIIGQSLHALTYLHSLNIVHRDLKPENILFAQRGKTVKLIDFGQGRFCIKKGCALLETKGTPLYMSPESIKGKYDYRCDLWSIGVLSFFLLSGKLPFKASSQEELESLILSCDWQFEEADWVGISKDAMKFIQGLIEPNVELRMTCEQALDHRWLKQNQINQWTVTDTEIAEIFLRLKSAKKKSEFQLAMRNLFLLSLDES